MPDVVVADNGTLVGLALITPAAKDWAAEHLPADAPRLGHVVYVEPRFVAAITDGMADDGLEVRTN